MPYWPFKSSDPNPESDTQEKAGRSKEVVPALGLKQFTDPGNLLAVVLLTSACLGSYHFFLTYLRRIPQATDIRPNFWRRRSLIGQVVRVGDGDNCQMYHTPGGRWAGWGLWRKVPTEFKDLKNKTIRIRIAGVDAPETAHFGNPEQPFGQEALQWLKSYLEGRRVRAYVYSKDHYDRAVASVYVWRWFWRRDVGLQMIRNGMAAVYEAKKGAEYGDLEKKYRKAMQKAKSKRVGMWAAKKVESPMDFKRRMAEGDPGTPGKGKSRRRRVGLFGWIVSCLYK